MSSSMSDRNNFLWRPNDNSATTLTRYRLEAEHWVNAFQSVQLSKTSAVGTLNVIALIIQFLIILGSLLLLLIIAGFKCFKNRNYQKRSQQIITPRHRYESDEDKLREIRAKRHEFYLDYLENKYLNRK